MITPRELFRFAGWVLSCLALRPGHAAAETTGHPQPDTATPAPTQKQYDCADAWRGHHTENRHIGLGGCTLIAPSWVITAAHDASKKARSPEKVNVEIKSGGQSRTVDKAFCAEGGDRAIAHLSEPVTHVTPVALCATKMEHDWGKFPMTRVSRGRGFKVVPAISAEGKKGGDRIFIGQNERPNQAGDSGCAFVFDRPTGTQDILIGVLHGTGRARQPAVFREWIVNTMAEHSEEKALWLSRPDKTDLKDAADTVSPVTRSTTKK